NIKRTSLLKDELGIDSFDSLRVIFEVEDEFNIKVPPDETLNIKTVNDIVNYIGERLNKTRQAA
ncbi:acyl carrier protein, partial [Candidatus Roizmanbacteria bacterium]|nr:acyl carrier protein [Candidatus Roizmanbacteria bacterium]